MEAIAVDVRDRNEMERTITDFGRSANGGLIVTGKRVGDDLSRADRDAGGSAQTDNILAPIGNGRSDIPCPRQSNVGPSDLTRKTGIAGWGGRTRTPIRSASYLIEIA